jgi:hypothetical protein
MVAEQDEAPGPLRMYTSTIGAPARMWNDRTRGRCGSLIDRERQYDAWHPTLHRDAAVSDTRAMGEFAIPVDRCVSAMADEVERLCDAIRNNGNGMGGKKEALLRGHLAHIASQIEKCNAIASDKEE